MAVGTRSRLLEFAHNRASCRRIKRLALDLIEDGDDHKVMLSLTEYDRNDPESDPIGYAEYVFPSNTPLDEGLDEVLDLSLFRRWLEQVTFFTFGLIGSGSSSYSKSPSYSRGRNDDEGGDTGGEEERQTRRPSGSPSRRPAPGSSSSRSNSRGNSRPSREEEDADFMD